MVKIFCHFCYFSLLSYSLADGVLRLTPESEADWPLHEIKFDKIGTLKNLYDAGLRPYWYPGAENTLVVIKKVRIRCTVMNNIVTPVFPCMYADIKLSEDQKIIRFTARSRPRTGAEAKSQIEGWRDIANNFEQSNLDRLVSQLQASGGRKPEVASVSLFGANLRIDDLHGIKPEFGLQNVARHGVGINYSENRDYPCILNYGVEWRDVIPEHGILPYPTNPIKPPAGYESCRLETPEHFGPEDSTPTGSYAAQYPGYAGGRAFDPNWRPPASTAAANPSPAATAVVKSPVAMPAEDPGFFKRAAKWLALIGLCLLAILLKQRQNDQVSD